MSQLQKNIIEPNLSSTQATSVVPCLFMVPICCLSKLLKQTINCHHWPFYAFASSAAAAAGTAAGAGPPVVGLRREQKFH